MRHFTAFGPTAVLIGTIVGVGMFGLPFVGYHSGFFVLLGYFGLVVGLLYAVNQAYSQIIIGTNGRHRFPGYVEQYLGHGWKQVAFATTTLGLWGALLSYLILGGRFLAGLFEPLIGGSALFYVLVFFVAGAYFVFRDAKTVARTELLLIGFFALVVVALVAFGLPKVNWSNLPLVRAEWAILPYGLTLFALWGANVLPDVAELTGRNLKRLNRISLNALVVSAALYLVFAVIVAGVSGANTTSDAFTGLRPILGEKALLIGYLFGLLATFTSFIALGLDLKKVFMFDYGFHPVPALLLTFGFPLAFYAAGLRNYLGVVSIIGGVILGIEGYLILRTYERFVRERRLLDDPSQFRLVRFARPLRFILALGVLIGLLTPYLLSRL